LPRTTRVTVSVVPLPIPTLIDAAGTVPCARDELAEVGDDGATEGDDGETCGGDPDGVATETGDTHATTKAQSKVVARVLIVMETGAFRGGSAIAAEASIHM
jgi:hypothetical protein